MWNQHTSRSSQRRGRGFGSCLRARTGLPYPSSRRGGAWDWSQESRLVTPVENPNDQALTLQLRVNDPKRRLTGQAAIAPRSSGNLAISISAPHGALLSALRVVTEKHQRECAMADLPPLPELRFAEVSATSRLRYVGDRFCYMEAGKTASSLPLERSQPTWSEVRLTLRWREMDSNHRSRLQLRAEHRLGIRQSR